MEIYLIDDGTLDTVVEVSIPSTVGFERFKYQQRFNSEYRFSFDEDPEKSTELFLKEIEKEFVSLLVEYYTSDGIEGQDLYDWGRVQ